MNNEEQKLIIWKREDDQSNTFETLQFRKTKNEFIAKSIVNGILEGQPILIEYQVVIDKDWVVKEVQIKSLIGSSKNIILKSNLKGKWYNEQNQEIPEFEGCIDIDISITPLTNSLPINRLKNVLEQRTRITVLYFDIENWKFKKVEQFYTNIAHNLYKYEGVFRNYAANIPTDNFGFVTTYPKLFKRIYPRN